MAHFPSSGPEDGPFVADPTVPPVTAMTPEVALEMLVDFLRRWGLIAIPLALVIGLGVSALVYRMLPVTYQATATVRMDTDENDWQRFKQTQVDLIRTDSVLNAALDDDQVKTTGIASTVDPVNELRSRLSFETSPISSVVSVNVDDREPADAQVLVNAIIEAYSRKSISDKSLGLASSQKHLDNQRNKLIQEIARLQGEQQRNARQQDFEDPASVREQLAAARDALRPLEERQTALGLERKKTQAEWQALLGATPELSGVQKTQLRAELATLDDLRQAARAADLDANEYGRNITQDNAAYYARRDHADSLAAKVRREEAAMRSAFEQDAMRDLSNQVAKAKRNLEVVGDQTELVDAEVAKITAEIGRLQKVAGPIDTADKQIERDQKELAEVEKRLAAIEERAMADDIQVSKASLPRSPSGGLRRLAMVAGAGLMIAGLVLVVFWIHDFRQRLISRPEHLQRSMNVPVLGILPIVPKGVRLPTDEDFAHGNRRRRQWEAMQEAINSLRITLTFSPDRSGGDGLKSLMISSPRDGEGKSTVVANLAVSLARTGARVCIVEADLHRPVQCETFEVPRGQGLIEVLKGQINVQDAVSQTHYPNLDILQAGEQADDIDAVMTPEHLQPVFDHLREEYDTVLIDAPPTLPVYDALVFGRQADQTVLCALCNHSQVYGLQQAVQRLDTVGVEVQGIVVNGASSSGRYGHYYYYYGYRDGRNTRPAPAGVRPSAEVAAKESSDDVIRQPVGSRS